MLNSWWSWSGHCGWAPGFLALLPRFIFIFFLFLSRILILIAFELVCERTWRVRGNSAQSLNDFISYSFIYFSDIKGRKVANATNVWAPPLSSNWVAHFATNFLPDLGTIMEIVCMHSFFFGNPTFCTKYSRCIREYQTKTSSPYYSHKYEIRYHIV